MAERGVIYTIWGNGGKYERALERSRRSLAAVHPELPVEVIRCSADSSSSRALLEKTHMFAATPFAETLYLDIDTVVLGRLDFGFEKARDFGIACCINECPWARRYAGLRSQPSAIEYNTGVLFFTRSAQAVFETWERLAPTFDSSIQLIRNGQLGRMAFNDQGAFAAAVEECKFNPFVLPLNWNFRPEYHYSFFGPIVIWHEYEDVPQSIIDLNRYYLRSDCVIQFHAAAPVAPGPARSGMA